MQDADADGIDAPRGVTVSTMRQHAGIHTKTTAEIAL